MAKTKFLTRIEHNEYCKRMEDHHKHTDKRLDEISESVQEMEQSIAADMNSMREEVHELNREFQENVNKMCVKVTELTGDVKQMVEMNAKRDEHDALQDKEIAELKSKPAKAWEKFIGAIIAGIATFVVGWMLHGGVS